MAVNVLPLPHDVRISRGSIGIQSTPFLPAFALQAEVVTMNLLVGLLLAAILVLLVLLLTTRWADARLAAELAQLKTEHAEAQRAANALHTDLRNQRAQYEAERTALSTRLTAAENEATRLRKWQVVDDADAKSRELTSLGETTLQNARTSAASLLTAAAFEKTRILEEARQEAQQFTGDAHAALEDARNSATSILSAAEAEKAAILEEAKGPSDSPTRHTRHCTTRGSPRRRSSTKRDRKRSASETKPRQGWT